MRRLLAALLLLGVPGTASAQPASAEQTSALQRMGAWGQELATAQQPVTDAYRDCSPTLQQTQTALQNQDREQLQALVAGGTYATCLDRMRAAARVARDNLLRVGAMPAEMERMLRVDSRAILRRAAASIDGVAGFNDRIGEALAALTAGDVPLMHRKLAESRALAGSVVDGQILLMETLRASMPMQFHKSMLDLRIALSRSMRMMLVVDPAAESGETSAGIRAEAARIRIAARGMQANWTRESVPMRRALARLGDRRRAATLVTLDQAIQQASATGVRLATSLEALPAGPLHPAAAMGALQALADAEIEVVGLAQRFAVAASELG
jgi:hypothetical protein